MWVRSPAYDGAWILSALPLGALFIALSLRISSAVIIFWVVFVVQTGHTLSPIALAWDHGKFRSMMLGRPWKFIVLPVAILIATTVAGSIAGRHLPDLRFDASNFSLSDGPTTLAQLTNPFMAAVALYVVWNGYHFGKQAFGVLSIYRRKRGNRGSRRIDLLYSCTVVWAAMVMPFIPRIFRGLHGLIGWPAHAQPFLTNVMLGYLAASLALPTIMLLHEWFTTRSLPRAIFILTDGLALALTFRVGLWGFAIIGLNHWLVAIGLAAHVDASANNRSPWWFAVAICAAGCLLFWLLFFDWGKGLSMAALDFTVAAVSFRLGIGFVHFLFDRWLYKFSDPRVRETIGKDMFMVVIKNDRSTDRDTAKISVSV